MKRITSAAVAMAVAACSPGGATASNEAPATAAPPTAEQVAAAEAAPVYFDPVLAKPRCPPQVESSKYPGPELAGLRLGMTRDEAVAVAYCDRKEFHVETERFFKLDTQGEELGPQDVTLRDGERSQCSMSDSQASRPGHCRYGEWRIRFWTQAIRLATPGLPGQERLLGIWRHQRFEEAPPTVEATVGSLIERFGQPGRIGALYGDALSLDDVKSGGRSGEKIELYWVWDTSGAVTTAANPQFRDCAGNLNAEFLESQKWSSECGLTVVAMLTRSEKNPAIASSYDVGLMNQQVLWQVNEAMEQHYREVEQKAQQDEVDRAKSAAAPDL
jgi:hypothetical protein